MIAQEFEIETLRRMTPAAKLAVMRTLIRQAYELKVAGMMALRPGLSREDAWALARAQVSGDRS
jgi:hypothetical protein